MKFLLFPSEKKESQFPFQLLSTLPTSPRHHKETRTSKTFLGRESRTLKTIFPNVENANVDQTRVKNNPQDTSDSKQPIKRRVL